MLVRKPARLVLLMLLTAALTLTACNMGATPAPAVDVNAINTAAVATALAQISAGQTQTALAVPSATPTSTTAPLVTVAGNVTPFATVTLGTPATLSFNVNPNTTPLAGFTPLGSPAAPAATLALGDACNNNQFIADITIPDGTIFIAGNEKGLRPGDDFKKIWRVKNTGNCKWDEGYRLVWIAGDDSLDPHTVKFEQSKDFVDPGETVDLGVTLSAPSSAGKYTATWRMQDDKGNFFGTPLTVVIEVKKK